ncbi:MAG: hypothetical protein Q9173_004849, partial [Seirophora scorigena]
LAVLCLPAVVIDNPLSQQGSRSRWQRARSRQERVPLLLLGRHKFDGIGRRDSRASVASDSRRGFALSALEHGPLVAGSQAARAGPIPPLLPTSNPQSRLL